MMTAKSETGTSISPDGEIRLLEGRRAILPYSHVTRTAHGADALAYARGHGRGHNGVENRNIYVAGVNMLPDEVIPFEIQMRKCWDRASVKHTTQIDRYILSFHPEELDADSPADCLKALKIGIEFARMNCPHSQSAVFVQSDGVGHKLHLHVASNDVRYDNFKGVDSSTYHHAHFSRLVDEICSKYFTLKQSEPTPERVTRAVRGRRIENEKIQAANDAEWELAIKEDRLPDRTKLRQPLYIWQDDLRYRIRQAADGAADEADFARRLRMDGVELVPCKLKDGTMSYRRPATKTHPEHYTYELVDTSSFDGKIPNNLKARSHKLGTDFMPDAVAKLFQPRRADAGAQEPAIRMPEAPSRKPAKAPEKPKAPEPGPKRDDEELERAYAAARRIIWPRYAEFMGWDTGRPTKIVDGEEQKDEDEWKRRGALLLRDWNEFGRWRARRKRELAPGGGKLEPIFDRDASTGAMTPRRESLLKQFADFLIWLSAERLRRKAEKQREAMVEEWERAAEDGEREYGDGD